MRKALKEMKADKCDPFSVYLIVPDVTSYVRLASTGGVYNLGVSILSSLSMRAKAAALLRGGFSFATSDFESLFKIFLDSELESHNRVAPGASTLRCVLLHEILTDTMLALRAPKLLETFYSHISNRHGLKPGFVTRNFASFVALLGELGLDREEVCIMTPFNAAGYQMAPSRQACETALSKVHQSRILAMSTLAAGYLTPMEAVDYLKHQDRLDGFVVGASSEQHLRETLGVFTKELSR